MDNPVSSWNEYDWEREIKRDELRISHYFKALPKYLDLPGEDEAIYRKLLAQKELAPVHGGALQWPLPPSNGEYEFEDDGLTNEELVANLRTNVGFDLFKLLEQAAREWNVFSVLNFEQSEVATVLRITCFYGKLLSRTYNYVEMDETQEYASLKRSLLRRVISDFNVLLGEFNALSQKSPKTALGITVLSDNLQHLRARALDLFFAV